MIIDMENIVCEKCKHHVFIPKTVFKKISSILSSSGRDESMPLEYLVCEKCGELAPMFSQDEIFKQMIENKQKNNTIIL
ncbi:MAG: hypothetical protein RSE41_05360 [Clostridia bacterium]